MGSGSSKNRKTQVEVVEISVELPDSYKGLRTEQTDHADHKEGIQGELKVSLTQFTKPITRNSTSSPSYQTESDVTLYNAACEHQEMHNCPAPDNMYSTSEQTIYGSNKKDCLTEGKPLPLLPIYHKNEQPKLTVQFSKSMANNQIPLNTEIENNEEENLEDEIRLSEPISNVPPSSTIFVEPDLDVVEPTDIDSKFSTESLLNNENESVDTESVPKKQCNFYFDEDDVYSILKTYKTRVKKELLDQLPSFHCLQLAQTSGIGTSTKIYRTKDGIPLPLPYIWEPHLTLTCDSLSIQMETLMDKLQSTSEPTSQLRFIYDLCMAFSSQDLRLGAQKYFRMDPLDDESDIYVAVFCHLCSHVNIPCKAIDGHIRSLEFTAENDWSIISQWVAVLHDDRWMLIDPHPINRPKWEELNCLFTGSAKHRKPKSIDHFFHKRISGRLFINPVELITCYFPAVSYWQLLCRPLSFNEWRNMAFVTPFFNELHLEFPIPYSSDITISSSQNLQIMFPKQSKLQFAARLHSVGGDVFDKPDISYTFVEVDTDEGIVNIKLSSDKSGILKVFAMNIDITTVYVLVCCFRVLYTKENICNVPEIIDLSTSKPSTAECGFPRNLLRFEWGPGNDTLLCGLQPISHKNSEITSSNNAVLIKFKRTKDDYAYDFNIENAEPEGLTISRRFVFYWYDVDVLTFRVSNPSKSKLIFNIMKKDTVYSSCNASVCSYLINFTEHPSCNCIPPVVDEGKLGITKYGRKEKFVFTDCVNGIIKTSNTGEVTLRLQNFNNIQIQPRLHLMTSCFHNMLRHVFITYNNTLVLIRINLPRRGEYLLSLHATDDNSDSQCLYNGLITVARPSLRWAPYPDLCLDRAFNIGLFSPKSGIVASKSEVYFSIEIPNALDVAVVSCKGWTHLDQTSDDIWEGQAVTGYAGTEMKIMARFEKGSDEYFRLLTYKVMAAEELENKTKHQLLLIKNQDYEIAPKTV